MRNFVTLAAFAAGANALPSSNGCCFHLTASGGASGTIGQLDDGQNRIGGSLPPAQFCIGPGGTITDGHGRGCILTPPTTQFQCDEGGICTPGFSVNPNGQLEYNGSTDFVACETGQNGGLNIYTTESADVTMCRPVQLNADACAGTGPSSTAPGVPSSPGPQSTSTAPIVSPSASTPGSEGPGQTPGVPIPGESITPGVPGSQSPGPHSPSTGTGVQPQPSESPSIPVQPPPSGTPQPQPSESPSPPQSSQPPQPQPSGECCPTDLSGDYEFPHLIVPVDSSSPDGASGTSLNGTVSPTVSTIFNFDVPATDAGRTCSLVFLFPKQEELETSAFSFSGDGRVQFGSVTTPASTSTTYNNAPQISENFGEFTIAPGNSYSICRFECPAGQTVGYEMSNAGSTNLEYFEDYNPSPACVVGFYILDRIEPYHQHFSLRNTSLQYPYAEHERISIAAAVACSGGGPLVIIAIYTLFIDGLFSHNKPVHQSTGKRRLMGPYRWKDRLWELNCGFLGLILSQALAFVITQALKNACGKPRPDIIDRCKPRQGSEDGFPYGLSDSSICTGDPHLLKDGFRSWPSASFAGLFFLSLWLGGKLHIMDNKGEVWKMFLVMFPCLGATLIAVSRIMDARHHPFDVISGSLLGIVCAIISYRQYFPSLSEPWKKGRAHPIRSWGTSPAYPQDYFGGANDSTVALRNPEEERMHQPGVSENPEAAGLSTSYPPPQTHPYVTNIYPRRSYGDTYSSSSEEDVTDGYEMQQGYTQTHNPAVSGHLPTYEPGMAYQSQTQPGPFNQEAFSTDSDGRPHQGHT
ncbi:ubiquitin 3 binding protein But2 C-terminal domain-containing protein [Aspergillus lucknowensis]|uniref:Ubiquitin 3 binding protein But2 C-terminal domain-containing protein n=1 Tax=Aspergillus lucknowensis TaxID=176173 RepID=A0ABR4M073_9EURO